VGTEIDQGRHGSVVSRSVSVNVERFNDPAYNESRIRRDPLSALDGFDYYGLGWADDYVGKHSFPMCLKRKL
jgi:hypothetical protein